MFLKIVSVVALVSASWIPSAIGQESPGLVRVVPAAAAGQESAPVGFLFRRSKLHRALVAANDQALRVGFVDVKNDAGQTVRVEWNRRNHFWAGVAIATPAVRKRAEDFLIIQMVFTDDPNGMEAAANLPVLADGITIDRGAVGWEEFIPLLIKLLPIILEWLQSRGVI